MQRTGRRDHELHPTIGAWQPEVRPAWLGSLTSTAPGHPYLARPQVTVTIIEPLPASVGDLQLKVGSLGPDGAELQEHRASFARTRYEAPGIAWTHSGATGMEDDEIEPVYQRRHHSTPGIPFGCSHQHKTLEGHTELISSDEP